MTRAIILAGLVALAGCDTVKIVPSLQVQVDQDGNIQATGGLTVEPVCDKQGCK